MLTQSFIALQVSLTALAESPRPADGASGSTSESTLVLADVLFHRTQALPRRTLQAIASLVFVLHS